MKSLKLLFITLGIWSGIFFPLFLASVFAQNHDADKANLLIPFALFMTILIWSELISANSTKHKQENNTKRKNTDQNADAALLLLQLLSDDERKDIRQRLIHGNDGELSQIFTNDTEAKYSERY